MRSCDNQSDIFILRAKSAQWKLFCGFTLGIVYCTQIQCMYIVYYTQIQCMYIVYCTQIQCMYIVYYTQIQLYIVYYTQIQRYIVYCTQIQLYIVYCAQIIQCTYYAGTKQCTFVYCTHLPSNGHRQCVYVHGLSSTTTCY